MTSFPMRYLSWFALLVAATAAPLAAQPSPAQTGGDQPQVEAELLPSKQVKKTFVSGLHKDYLVVRISVTPAPGSQLDLNRDQFRLRTAEQSDVAPENPAVLAQDLSQRQGEKRDVSLYPTAEIGYRSGPDARYPTEPGYERKGVYYGAGVGVGIGGGQSSTLDDREVMELELSEKELPEGVTSQSVSGHLYFLNTLKKRKPVELVYRDGSGQELVLKLKR